MRLPPFGKPVVHSYISAGNSWGGSELFVWVRRIAKKFTSFLLLRLHLKLGLCMEGMNNHAQGTIGFSTAFNGWLP